MRLHMQTPAARRWPPPRRALQLERLSATCGYEPAMPYTFISSVLQLHLPATCCMSARMLQHAGGDGRRACVLAIRLQVESRSTPAPHANMCA